MGAPDSPSSDPNANSNASSVGESGTYEKWLVRILLTVAFGLAFGIEGMTLLRSFVFDTGGDAPVESREKLPVLEEGEAIVPGAGPTVRAHRLRLYATDEAWTFTLVTRPDGPLKGTFSVVFDTLTTTNGTVRTSAPSRTWTASDTSSFEAVWALPPGQRPDALTVTATTRTSSDTTTTRRTVDVGHVPVRMQ